MKRKLLLFVCLILSVSIKAQIDTEFWFAAPELTEGANETYRRDSTIYMVVSGLTQDATVRILLPADLSFAPIEVNVTAGTTMSIPLHPFLSQIESKPPAEILNTGILVRATKPITAYYEVRTPNNTDIFSLKGKNAIGTKFYTPFQTDFENNEYLNNNNPYIPPPRGGFIVIATDDSTTVSITPSVDVVGHTGGETFELLLMRGQTYYCEALSNEAVDKPAGSKIVSDKPIAVTVKDDMIDKDSGYSNADLAGDQLISYENTGTEHIIIKGNMGVNERITVLATADNTELFIDGSTTPAVVINEGEQYSYTFTPGVNVSYLVSTEKVFVLHTSGHNDQFAAAIIPSVNCTGSNQVGFAKTIGSSAYFRVNVTIRAGAEGNFVLTDGNNAVIPNAITAADFQPVPGSNGEYVYCRKDLSIPASTYQLTNFSTELFHLGIQSSTSGAGCNYGYFTSFSYLNIGTATNVCIGDSLVLDAGPGKTEYIWSTGDSTQTITIHEAGQYVVTTFSGSLCSASDTIDVNYYEPPIDLGPNDTICAGSVLNFELNGSYLFTWQDSTMGSSYAVTDEGWYSVNIEDFQGCTTVDSIYVSVRPRPETPSLLGDTVYCEGDMLDLELSDYPGTATNIYYRIKMPNNAITSQQNLLIPEVELDNSGQYIGYYVVDGCESFADTINVTVNEAPEVSLGMDTTLCEGLSYIIEPTVSSGDSYEWQDGSTEQTFTATESGSYYLMVTNAADCFGSDTVSVNFDPLPELPVVSGDNMLCEGDTLALSTQGEEGAIYTWSGPDGFASNLPAFSIQPAFIANSGVYNVFATLGECSSDDVDYEVQVNPNPVAQITADTIICAGATTTLDAGTGFTTYEWSTGEFTQTLEAGEGTYMVEISNEFGCFDSTSIQIYENDPVADFEILPDTLAEPGELLNFTDLSTSELSQIVTYSWTFGDEGISSQINPEYAFASYGTYIITLGIADEFGCTDTVAKEVLIKYPFKIPEAFSPNGDGINEAFVVHGLEEFPNSGLQIFNRWGAVVFETSNYQNNWTGSDVVEGTYFYVLKLSNGQTHKGSLTLVR